MLIPGLYFVAAVYVLVVIRGVGKVVGFGVFEGSTGVLSESI